MPLLGRQPIPAHRFAIVLPDAAANRVQNPEVELRHGVSLLGRQSIPPHRFTIVLRDAAADGVPDPEVELRLGTSLLSRRPMPPPRLRIVLRDAVPELVEITKSALCRRVALCDGNKCI